MAMVDAPTKKIVVLDVDETLGYFVELGIFCDALTKIAWNNDATGQYAQFNRLMDLYPEFLRPNILDLLTFLKMKKDSNECCGVMVYTNNNGPRLWVEHIVKYMESKLGARLFDQIVAAFKVNGQVIEMGRTTHDKTYDDLLRCTRLPANVEVCFLDDQMHSQMEHEQVYYIHVKPYVHQLNIQTLIDRFMQSSALRATIGHMSIAEVRQRITKFMQPFQATHVPKDPMEQDIDAIISKKIMEHLNSFFKGVVKTNASQLPQPSTSNHSNTLKMKHQPDLKTKTVKNNKNKL